MSEYIAPEIEIISFNANDVITTSVSFPDMPLY